VPEITNIKLNSTAIFVIYILMALFTISVIVFLIITSATSKNFTNRPPLFRRLQLTWSNSLFSLNVHGEVDGAPHFDIKSFIIQTFKHVKSSFLQMPGLYRLFFSLLQLEDSCFKPKTFELEQDPKRDVKGLQQIVPIALCCE
jgi:hypothetical protein